MDKLAKAFYELQDIIQQYNSFLLIVHPHPDADALGAAFSLRSYIHKQTGSKKKKTKTTEIYSLDLPMANLASLFDFKKITTKLNLEGKEVVIFLDRGDVYHLLKFPQKIAASNKPPRKIVNIDHHLNTRLDNALNIRDTKASSTSEIIYRFFQTVGFSPTPTEAQYLLSGIWFDTGGFKHSNTSAEVLKIAGELMRQGASLNKIIRAASADKPLNVLRLWGLALKRAQINKQGIVYSYLTKKDLQEKGVKPEELNASYLSELLNTIANTKFSIMLTENADNTIKASLRSEEHKKTDVAKIARRFLGGGHKLASGFEIKGKIKPTKDGFLIE